MNELTIEQPKIKKINKWDFAFVIQYKYKNMPWEDVSEYSKPDYEKPYRSAIEDLKEYRVSSDGSYRLIRRKILSAAWEKLQN